MARDLWAFLDGAPVAAASRSRWWAAGLGAIGLATALVLYWLPERVDESTPSARKAKTTVTGYTKARGKLRQPDGVYAGGLLFQCLWVVQEELALGVELDDLMKHLDRQRKSIGNASQSYRLWAQQVEALRLCGAPERAWDEAIHLYEFVRLARAEDDRYRHFTALLAGWAAADLGQWEEVAWIVERDGKLLASRDDLFGARFATLRGRLLAERGELQEAEVLLREGFDWVRNICEPDLPTHRLLIEAREAREPARWHTIS